MSYSTVYDVKVRYSVDNRTAGQATTALKDQTRQLATEAKNTSGEFMKMGAVIFGVFAGHEARKALITFNRDVQTAKIGLASMIQGNTGGTWERATEKAKGLYDEFQRFSQLTPVTTQEILEFSKGVAVSTFQAGGSIKDLTMITEQSVVAAKALGDGAHSASYYSLEVSELLMGNVNKRMLFARQLLGMAHMEIAEFNALTASQRLGVIERVLNSDSMKNAAKAFGESWAGVTSTLEDKLQIVFGKVGLPLFEALTAEAKNWNGWIEQNRRRIEEMGHKVGEGLAKGFGYVKDVVGFIASHADTLIAIGKVWLAVKLGGMVAGGITGGMVAGGGALAAFRQGGFFHGGRAASDKIDPYTGEYTYTPSIAAGRGRAPLTMGAVAGALPLIAQSAALGYTFGTMISEATGLKDALHNLAIGETGRQFERVNRAADALTESLHRAADANPKASPAITNLEGVRANYAQQAQLIGDYIVAQQRTAMGAYGSFSALSDAKRALDSMGIDVADFDRKGGAANYQQSLATRAAQLQQQKDALIATGADAWEMGLMSLTEYQRQTLDEAKAAQDLLAYINNSLARGIPILPKSISEILRADTDDPEGKHKKIAEKPNVNVHIARIEVQSDDPDRMAFGLIEAFRDAAKNPSSAFATLREG